MMRSLRRPTTSRRSPMPGTSRWRWRRRRCLPTAGVLAGSTRAMRGPARREQAARSPAFRGCNSYSRRQRSIAGRVSRVGTWPPGTPNRRARPSPPAPPTGSKSSAIRPRSRRRSARWLGRKALAGADQWPAPGSSRRLRPGHSRFLERTLM